MKNYKLPIVLFFIAGAMPNEEEQAQAEELKAQVRFRNVSLFDPADCLEKFDDVAGMVPKKYAEAKEAAEAAKVKAAEDAAERERIAAEVAAVAEKEAAKGGKKSGGASGVAPTNSPAPVVAPGAGSGPPADWKPA